MIARLAWGKFIACAALALSFAHFALAQNHGQELTEFRIRAEEPAPGGGGGAWAGGGIAGVGYSENFESGYSYGCQPDGMNCSLEIIDHPDPNFGAFSMLNRAVGSGMPLQEFRTPLFTLEPGGIYADIIINNNFSLFQFITVNGTTGFFNTRVNFEANGSMTVLQIDGSPPCTSGAFAATTGTWTPGVKMRVGVEVINGGPQTLKVYKDGVQIFAGHDISQFCSAGNPAVGMSQLRNFNSNIGTTATFVIDNISSSALFNPCDSPLSVNCPADVHPPGGNGVVDIDDLVQGVIHTWGQTQNPPGTGPRPLGDCAPLPSGDCEVDVDDLLQIISGWGQCPAVVGACCIQGVCITLQPEVCTGAPWFGTYHGDFLHCSQVTCPTPPKGDMCGSPITAVNGANNWNNTNANTDGPAVACAPSGAGRGDIWFAYTATCSGQVTFDTLGTQAPFTDTILQVFNGINCNPPGELLGCNDNISSSTNALSRITIDLAQGQQVLIRCASNSWTPASNSGAAILNIECVQVSNHECGDAWPISDGATAFTVLPNRTDGTPNESMALNIDCNDFGATQTVNDIWYRYVATCDGLLTVSTCSTLGGATNFNSDLVLYAGSALCPPGGPLVIACNDDDPENPCGLAWPYASTLRANVTAGQSYLLRVGGWGDEATDFGTGVLRITCEESCGNGSIDPGETCDDGNSNCEDGCCDCMAQAACEMECDFFDTETCVQGPDTVNGGCNFTPAIFTPVTLTAGQAVMCGELWATEVGTVSTRDLDWYTVTVGPSGVVQAHLRATSGIPVVVFAGSVFTYSSSCSAANIVASETGYGGECVVAAKGGLTPGSQAVVIAASGSFSGFPCSQGPWTYSLRIVSP